MGVFVWCEFKQDGIAAVPLYVMHSMKIGTPDKNNLSLPLKGLGGKLMNRGMPPARDQCANLHLRRVVAIRVPFTQHKNALLSQRETDCHVASLLAMTEIFYMWPFLFPTGNLCTLVTLP